ncbi:uncharacterized protein [Parasteatoda tepidariorum]|uniref:uncharacterized protein isoform X2 n=2 Tax=Parasteatoda tepidariorum TaxID=114398 RepID=UPI001C718730|nr:uncharacterized protein LOC107455557 isoform X2 [Parasteatoda tepidariorum]
MENNIHLNNVGSSDLFNNSTEEIMPSKEAMRGLELKGAVDNLLKRSTSVDETTPINLAKNKVVDHGTIPMDRTLSADDIYQSSCKKKYHSDSSDEPKKQETRQGMSLLRKLCFILSFNGGILYIVAFAWLIPCWLSPCLLAEEKWTLNLTSLQLSTNLRTNTQSNPTLVIFGHVNEDGGKLKSLTVSNGKEMWNNTLPEEPSQVFCNLRSNCKICFVTGKRFIAAVHAENGSIIWNQTIMTDEPISTLFLTQEKHNRTYLVGISHSNLHLFVPEDGQQVAIATLPCSWTVLIKVAGPWYSSKTGFVWALVCQSNDGVDAFTFFERDLLDFSENDEDLENLRVNFKPIFRKRSYRGSIDLACDVTTTPDSLVLSWADMVTMVTAQAPFHHFHKTWEQRFSSPLGYVTSLTTGYFTGSKSTQIAVAVQDGSNSTIHILETKNGSSIAEMKLGEQRVVSIQKLSGAEGERDALLIDAIKNEGSSDVEPAELEPISFYMLEFEENKSALRFIATSQGHLASSLSQISKGSSNLLLASSDTNGNVILDRFIVQNKDPTRSLCQDEQNSNTTVMMFLE